MLNLRPYDENEIIQLNLINNPPVYLRLLTLDNTIRICVVNDKGNLEDAGNLLSFLNDGCLLMYPEVGTFGFNLDTLRRIKIVNN